MAARESRYTGMVGDWRKIHGLVEANRAEVPQLEPFLVQLGAILAQWQDAANRQGAMRAAKQEASKQVRKLAREGNRLAALIRLALIQHYGVSEEKLAEFGLQPFRGRARKTPEEEPQAPQPAPPESPPASTGSQ